MTLLEKLLPAQANNNYCGSKIAVYGFGLLMAMYTFRSFVHFLKEDSGVNSIASIHVFPVDGIDPNTVIYMFSSLWGGQQVITLMIYFVVLFKYRNLLSLMWLTILFELAFRMVSGELHTLTSAYYEHVPPGKVGNLPILVYSVIMFVLSLRHRPDPS